MALEDMEVIILGIIGGQSGVDDAHGLDTGGLDTGGLDTSSLETSGLDICGHEHHDMDGDDGDNIGAAVLEARAIAAFHDLNPAMAADEDGMPVVVPVDAAALEATRVVFTTALAHLIQSDSVAETTTASGETAFRLN